MKLVCVIVNYRTAEMTADAVRAARRALAPIPTHRIDVVDNASGDGSLERLRALAEAEGWDDVDVLASDVNGGFGAGNNLAIRRALTSDDPPDYVWLLNSDAFPRERAATALVDFMERGSNVGIAGSAIWGTDGDPHISAFRFPSLASEVLGSVRLGALARLLPDREVPIHPRPERAAEVDWLAGASMMIRRALLEEVGLFDETFFLYYEETDLCRRARAAGWEIWYVIESQVEHVRHASTRLDDRNARMPRYWFDSRRHYFRKNHGRAYAYAVNAVQALGLASFKVRARLQKKDDPDPENFLRDFVRYNFLERPP